MRLPAFLTTPGPATAVSIEADAVAVVTLGGRGLPPTVTGHTVEPLPPGAVVPALNAANIADPQPVAAALKRAFERLRLRPRRIGLILPDEVGKVSLVRLDKPPARAADLDQLIRFHVRKAAPFKLEDAQVTFAPGAALEGGGREFVVVVARTDVVGEYEGVCARAGAHAGTVDLATLNVVNLVASGSDRPNGDWLLVRTSGRTASIAILRGGSLIFYRHRADEEEGNLASLIHQTTMYYEDRLGGGGFERVVVTGAGSGMGEGARGADQVRRVLEDRSPAPVTFLDPAASARFADRISVSAGTFDTFAPLIGLLMRDRAAA